MRISTLQHANWTTQELNKVKSEVANYQEQVPSGKKYARIGDNPLATSKSLAIRHVIRDLQQMQKDVTDADSVLKTTENALGGIQQTLDRVSVLTEQALNGTSSQEDLNVTATEIGELIKQTIYLANTSQNGHYVFGGDNNTTLAYDNNGTYKGGNQSVSWHLNDGYDVAVYRNADSVLTPTIQTLQKIQTQLQNGDKTGLLQSFGENKTNIDKVVGLRADVGSNSSTLKTFTDILAQQNIGLEEDRSSVEDVDMTEAISNFMYMNATYQATLQAVTMTNKVSILNYI
ncbi:flagellar hook-associated protein 3 [Microbacteriaceae bacterium 4G12]